MLHKFFLADFGMLLMAGFALAAEVKITGKVKGIEKEKGTITVMVDDMEKTLTGPKEAKLVEIKGGKKAEMDLKGGLAQIKEGKEVTITVDRKTEKVEGAEDKVTDTVL